MSLPGLDLAKAIKEAGLHTIPWGTMGRADLMDAEMLAMLDGGKTARQVAEHLSENLQALNAGPLPPDVYAEARRRLARAGLVPD